MAEVAINDHLSIGVLTPHARGGSLMAISNNLLSPIRIGKLSFIMMQFIAENIKSSFYPNLLFATFCNLFFPISM